MEVNEQALADYLQAAAQTLEAVSETTELAAWHQTHLSRHGELNQFKRHIGQLPEDARRAFGASVNQAATHLTNLFKQQSDGVKLTELQNRLRSEKTDVTLPVSPKPLGRYHPITQALREIGDIFNGMGFSIFESPHVELDETCFQLLNIPKHHPARDMTDTFYVSEDVVIRPHTSPGQIRVMQASAPEPVQVILPGTCYRHEDVTPRSEIQFHQVELLLVGELVCFSDLKGILLRFARSFFGDDQAIRLRGSYFPFTEPSVEVDIKCTLCQGRGCRVCKSTGWLELLGAGMVHPTVLRNGGYDPDKVQGIAAGMGIERIVMLRYYIDDIRHFFANDLRFLSQFF